MDLQHYQNKKPFVRAADVGNAAEFAFGNSNLSRIFAGIFLIIVDFTLGEIRVDHKKGCYPNFKAYHVANLINVKVVNSVMTIGTAVKKLGNLVRLLKLK